MRTIQRTVRCLLKVVVERRLKEKYGEIMLCLGKRIICRCKQLWLETNYLSDVFPLFFYLCFFNFNNSCSLKLHEYTKLHEKFM